MLRPAQSEIESNKGRILRAGFQMPMVGLVSVAFDAKGHKVGRFIIVFYAISVMAMEVLA